MFVDDHAVPSDLGRPGHIILSTGGEGGVLRRAGHTEATLDLCTLAGFKPVGVGCEILAEDGTMMRLPDLRIFAEEHGLKLGDHRRPHRLPSQNGAAGDREAGPIDFPTKFGDFTLYVYESKVEPHPTWRS